MSFFFVSLGVASFLTFWIILATYFVGLDLGCAAIFCVLVIKFINSPN
jgi:hypothetical protein